MQQRTVKRRESDILSSCLRFLKAGGIFALRMQVGAMKIDGRFVRFGVAGMADILAIPSEWKGKWGAENHDQFFRPLWIECKREGEKQSPAQKEFQKIVEAEGHRYLVVTSAYELNKNL